MNKRPDMLASVYLLPTSQGGRQGAISYPNYRCLLSIRDVNLDIRLRIGQLGCIALGRNIDVKADFLDPEFAKENLKIGDEFYLREAKVIGSGFVKRLLI